MKIGGYILTIGGLVALIATGINYINNSDSFSAFGLDIAVSKGNPVPVIISVVILAIGIIIINASNNN